MEKKSVLYLNRVRQMMVDKYVDEESDPEVLKSIDQAYADMKKKKDPWITASIAVWWIASIQT